MPSPHRMIPPGQPDRKARAGTFRRIVHTFRPYRLKVSFVALLILVTAGLGLINPLLIKVVFEDVILGDGTDSERL
ncbi:MAG: hypothetical protein ACLGHL_10790, partial [Actinomycetota bacterium]